MQIAHGNLLERQPRHHLAQRGRRVRAPAPCAAVGLDATGIAAERADIDLHEAVRAGANRRRDRLRSQVVDPAPAPGAPVDGQRASREAAAVDGSQRRCAAHCKGNRRTGKHVIIAAGGTRRRGKLPGVVEPPAPSLACRCEHATVAVTLTDAVEGRNTRQPRGNRHVVGRAHHLGTPATGGCDKTGHQGKQGCTHGGRYRLEDQTRDAKWGMNLVHQNAPFKTSSWAWHPPISL